MSLFTWLLLALMIMQALDPRSAAAQAARAEAPAMTEAARLHYEKGLALYAEKDYAGAIAEFEAGHALEPRREFLFAEAQAKRLAGDCAGAVPLYQKFLETEPTPAQVNATQMGLARCAQQMAARPAPIAGAQEPAVPAPQPAPQPPPPPATLILPPQRPQPPPPPAWYRDPLGATLLGAGLVGLGVGSGFLVASFAARGSGASYPEYQRSWQTAEQRWTVGVVALAAGGVLTGAAVTRLVLVRRRTRLATEIGATILPPALSPPLFVLGGRF